MASVSHRIIYESEFNQKLSEVPQTSIASAHSSNKLQEMGSRGRQDAEFQGGKYPNLHFNKLVSGARVSRDVHKNLHLCRTDLFNFAAMQMAAIRTSCDFLMIQRSEERIEEDMSR